MTTEPTRPRQLTGPTPASDRLARAGRRGTALCLSGGGYRAALFHLGAVRRLNELGILGGIRTVSAVSGGAVVANLLTHPELDFTPGAVVEGFEELVAQPLRRLAAHNARTPALLARLWPTRWKVPDAAVRALADELARQVPWWGRPLRESARADGPGVVTGATEVSYGVDWVFEDAVVRPPRGRVGDYRVGYAAPPPGLRIADVVAASCAMPPFFAPLALDGEALGLAGGRAGPRGPQPDDRGGGIRRHLQLTDGGVYDNLALEPVWKSHSSLLVSDGGSVFRARTQRTLHGRMLRILDTATSGGRSVRVRWLQAAYARGALQGTTWALDTVVDGSYDPATTELVGGIRTDLDAFSRTEQHVLERHGYLVADARVRAHAAHLVVLAPPLVPPHPEVADARVVARALAGSGRRTLLGRF
jgi:NTE family protein